MQSDRYKVVVGVAAVFDPQSGAAECAHDGVIWTDGRPDTRTFACAHGEPFSEPSRPVAAKLRMACLTLR